jgi:hypothetical protein
MDHINPFLWNKKSNFPFSEKMTTGDEEVIADNKFKYQL